MVSSAAAFYADGNEQLNNSSLNESVWDPSVYYPPIETSGGVYYDNFWGEFCYTPVYYGYQYYSELYQPFMANIYGEFQSVCPAVYYNSPVYYDVYDYPFAVTFVPVIYYPVLYLVPIIYSAIQVPYQYNDVQDLDDTNGFQHMTTEKKDGILTNFPDHKVVSAEQTTFEVYYNEDGERLNDTPLNNDDKKEIEDNKSSSCNSESMCKESCLGVVDSDFEDTILQLCSAFEKLSLLDNEENSSPSKSEDNSAKDSSTKSEDNSSEDSPYSDSDDDNDTAIERKGNVMDIHHIDDYSQSSFVTSSSCGDKKYMTKENSEVITEVDEECFPICIDMIVSSEEYLYIQDNLEHPKLYKDYLYRNSLKNNPRCEKNNLFDVLPTIEEETTSLMDDTPLEFEDEINVQDPMIVSPEMISSVEDEPVISEVKQPKRRLKSFKKWLYKTFCCCCTTKDPP